MSELLLEDDSTICPSSFLGLETRSPYRGSPMLNNVRPASQSGRVGLELFRNTIRELLHCPAQRVAALHNEAGNQIRLALDPVPYVEALLDLCISNRSAGSMDFAIDLLAQMGELALRFAQEFYNEDAPRWANQPTFALRFNGDVWFVLLRSAARAQVNPRELLALLRACLTAGNRGIREAAVEGLYDLRTPEAKRLLAEVATKDADPLIQRLAHDNLNDLKALEK